MRLIPAHAGKTTLTPRRRQTSAAHPRSRGENALNFIFAPFLNGSSPLTRGKPDCLLLDEAQIRLIPAHAGKTRAPCACRTSPPAHPRSRGENPTYMGALTVAPGSSPLTRGKPRGLRRSCGQRRLIPAHAGKTRPLVRPDQAVRAHPRSRGENRRTRYRMSSRGGSSPLTRGKRLSSLSLWGPLGLIPAHAGKTHTYWHRVGPRSAHPRSRGENSPAIPSLFRRSGSSPLTRGKLW